VKAKDSLAAGCSFGTRPESGFSLAGRQGVSCRAPLCMIYPTWIQLKWTMLGVGLVLLLAHLFALMKSQTAREWLRKFPRNYEIGVLLTIVATIWFYMMVKLMDLGEFTSWRPTVLFLTPIAGILAIFFMRDYLAVRALGTIVLLAAEPLLESAFLRDEQIRLLLVTLVYLWILFGMFWVGMPYTLRDQITWVTASEKRWRAAAFAGLAYGTLLCIGGLTVPLFVR
jgi:hypothetical protein